MVGPVRVRITASGSGLRNRVDVELQSRAPKHGIGWHHAKTTAGHGRIDLLIKSPQNGGITGLLARTTESE